jgi:hypothetical protein
MKAFKITRTYCLLLPQKFTQEEGQTLRDRLRNYIEKETGIRPDSLAVSLEDLHMLQGDWRLWSLAVTTRCRTTAFIHGWLAGAGGRLEEVSDE